MKKKILIFSVTTSKIYDLDEYNNLTESFPQYSNGTHVLETCLNHAYVYYHLEFFVQTGVAPTTCAARMSRQSQNDK